MKFLFRTEDETFLEEARTMGDVTHHGGDRWKITTDDEDFDLFLSEHADSVREGWIDMTLSTEEEQAVNALVAR